MNNSFPLFQWLFPTLRMGSQSRLRATLLSPSDVGFPLCIDVIDVNKVSCNGVTPDSFEINENFPCCCSYIDEHDVRQKMNSCNVGNEMTRLIATYLWNYCLNNGVSISSGGKMQIVSCLVDGR